jgi:hypothetical protein
MSVDTSGKLAQDTIFKSKMAACGVTLNGIGDAWVGDDATRKSARIRNPNWMKGRFVEVCDMYDDVPHMFVLVLVRYQIKFRPSDSIGVVYHSKLTEIFYYRSTTSSGFVMRLSLGYMNLALNCARCL